jgi:hypothetical protein
VTVAVAERTCASCPSPVTGRKTLCRPCQSRQGYRRRLERAAECIPAGNPPDVDRVAARTPWRVDLAEGGYLAWSSGHLTGCPILTRKVRRMAAFLASHGHRLDGHPADLGDSDVAFDLAVEVLEREGLAVGAELMIAASLAEIVSSSTAS